jgi:predicted secreted protein
MGGMTRTQAAKAGSASATIAAFRTAALLTALWTATPGQAGPVLSLDAQARAAVSNDEMVVVLAVERDGAQVGPLNDAVLSQLNAAIAEARGVEGVKARLGAVYTQPNYTREGKTQGWRVRGEIVLESTRMAALAQLGARLGERMQHAGVQFRLSSERRQLEEKRLIAEAARAFRARAADAAAAFGFAGYELRELALRSGSTAPGPRPMAAMARGGAEVAAAPLPTEGGDSDVVVGVSGSVELKP